MKYVIDALLPLQDTGYRDFHTRLVPTIDPKTIIGVRMPLLRRFARDFARDPRSAEFITELPHTCYEENSLHALLINNQAKSISRACELLDAFLPYVDNWAVCDTLSVKPFERQPEAVYPKILEWMHSDRTYTARFAVDALMAGYLGDAFNPDALGQVADLRFARTAEGTADRTAEYYVNMARAWFFAEALVKNTDAALPYFTSQRLDDWTHNKALQKARESRRIDDEMKAHLQSLKVKANSAR
jgi:3-methyladenine DNA glycosylase AlkD